MRGRRRRSPSTFGIIQQRLSLSSIHSDPWSASPVSSNTGAASFSERCVTCEPRDGSLWRVHVFKTQESPNRPCFSGAVPDVKSILENPHEISRTTQSCSEILPRYDSSLFFHTNRAMGPSLCSSILGGEQTTRCLSNPTSPSLVNITSSPGTPCNTSGFFPSYYWENTVILTLGSY